MFGKRQGADAFAGGGENGVADGRENGRKRGLAEAGGGIISLEEMDFDFGGHLIHAERRIFMEIALHGAARVDGDFVRHNGAQTFDDGAANLILGVERIDDLAADVTGDPNFVYFHFGFGINAQLNDFGKVAAVSKLEGDAHAGAARELLRAPAGFFGDEF